MKRTLAVIDKLDLVMALYIFGVLTSEVMGVKTIPVFQFSWLHLNASVAIFVVPLLFILVNAVVEVHGRAKARSMVLSGLVVVALLILYSELVTHVAPSAIFTPTNKAYVTIFSYSARIAAASLTAYATSELLNVFISSNLRRKLQGRALWFRNNAASFVAQFADSTIFLSLAFYSTSQSFSSNYKFLISLIIPYWLLRCALSLVETPLVYLGVRWLRGTSTPTEAEQA